MLHARGSRALTSTKVVIAAAQIRATPSVRENLRRIKRNVKSAAEKGADVVVFPETALTGYFADYIESVKPTEVQAALEEIQQVCRDEKMSTIVGAPVYAANGEIRNSALIFGPDGELIGEQAKVRCCFRNAYLFDCMPL